MDALLSAIFRVTGARIYQMIEWPVSPNIQFINKVNDLQKIIHEK
jgi:hypothetical protein